MMNRDSRNKSRQAQVAHMATLTVESSVSDGQLKNELSVSLLEHGSHTCVGRSKKKKRKVSLIFNNRLHWCSTSCSLCTSQKEETSKLDAAVLVFFGNDIVPVYVKVTSVRRENYVECYFMHCICVSRF